MTRGDELKRKKEIEQDYTAFIKYVNLRLLPLVLTQFLEDLGKNPDMNENLIYRVVLMLCGQEVQEYINQHEKMKSRIRLTYCTAWRTSEDNLVESDIFASPGNNVDLAGYDRLLKLEKSMLGKSVKTDATGPFEYIKETDKPYLMIVDNEGDHIRVLSKDNMISPAGAVRVSIEKLPRTHDGVLKKFNFNLAFVQKVDSVHQAVEATTGYPYSGFFFDYIGEHIEDDLSKDIYNDLSGYLRNLRASISLINTLVLSQDLIELIRMQAALALNMLRFSNLRHSITNSLTNISGCVYNILDESGRDVVSDAFEEKEILIKPGKIGKRAIFDRKQIQDQLAKKDRGRTEYISSLVMSIENIAGRISETKQREQESIFRNLTSQNTEEINLKKIVLNALDEINATLTSRGIAVTKNLSDKLEKVRTRSDAVLILMNLLYNAQNYCSENALIRIDGDIKPFGSTRVITFVVVNETDKPVSQEYLNSLMSGRRSRRLGHRGLFYSRFFTRSLRDGKLSVSCTKNIFKAELSFKED